MKSIFRGCAYLRRASPSMTGAGASSPHPTSSNRTNAFIATRQPSRTTVAHRDKLVTSNRGVMSPHCRSMRRYLLLAACSHPVPTRPVEPLSGGQWTVRCAERIEIARLALVPLDRAFAAVELQIDAAPWHPTLR